MSLIAKLYERKNNSAKEFFMECLKNLISCKTLTKKDVISMYEAIKQDPFNFYPECHKSKKPKLVFVEMEYSDKAQAFGSYSVADNTLSINEKALIPENILEIIDTLFHEYTHFMQKAREEKKNEELKKKGLLTKTEEELRAYAFNLRYDAVKDAILRLRPFLTNSKQLFLLTEDEEKEDRYLNLTAFGMYYQLDNEVEARSKAQSIVETFKDKFNEEENAILDKFIQKMSEINSEYITDGKDALDFCYHILFEEIDLNKLISEQFTLDYITAKMLGKLLFATANQSAAIDLSLCGRGFISDEIKNQLLTSRDTKFKLIDRWLELLEDERLGMFTTENNSPETNENNCLKPCDFIDCQISPSDIKRNFSEKEVEDMLNDYIDNGKYHYVIHFLNVYSFKEKRSSIKSIYKRIEESAIEEIDQIFENKELKKYEKVQKIKYIEHMFASYLSKQKNSCNRIKEHIESLLSKLSYTREERLEEILSRRNNANNNTI